MKRSIFVGVAAAVFAILLISISTYLELRYTENGAFMREWAVNGKPSCRFDDCIVFMNKWVRIHEFVMSPSAALFVGLLVGSLSQRKYWASLLIGVTPIVVIHLPSDVLSAASGVACMAVAWLGVKSAQVAVKRFMLSRETAAVT